MERKFLKGHGSNVRIHYVSNHFAIVEKEAGVGCHPTSEFHLRLKYLLWEGEMIESEKQRALNNEKIGNFEGLQLLYNPGKAVSGLLVVARNSASMIYVRSLLQSKRMKIVYSCIICGKLGEEGTEIIINSNGRKNCSYSSCNATKDNDGSSDDNNNYADDGNDDTLRDFSVHLRVNIVKNCKSRAAGCLSHLQIEPIFESPHDDVYTRLSMEEKQRIFMRPSCKDDYDYIMFPSRIVKNIRNYFLSRDNPIVGENNIVKKTKGMFISITRVSFTDIDINGKDSDNNILLDDPVKFTTLLKTEEDLWTAWNENNKKILRQGNDDANISQEADDLLSKGYPVQYMTGKALFYGYDFCVDENVMIPRKSSEVLVKAAVDHISKLVNSRCNGEQYVYTLLDLGTGSGSLLLSSMLELKKRGIQVKGIGIDISPGALDVARRNAQMHSITNDEIVLELGNFETIDRTLFSCTDEMVTTHIDVILCNPPYSSANEVHRLSISTVVYEPHVALYCKSGQSIGNYRTISASLLRIVEDNLRSSSNRKYKISEENICIFEIGHGQVDDVKGIFMKSKTKETEGRFHFVSSLRDHNDLLRCLIYKLQTQ